MVYACAYTHIRETTMPKWITYLLIALITALLIVALAGPIGPLPGVRLGGNATPAPASWAGVSLPDEVQIKASNGLIPRVVNIWIVELNDSLYVFGVRDSGWVNAAIANPHVNLRVNNETFTLQAEPLDNPSSEIYEQYVARYAANYPDIMEGMSQQDMAESGIVFRLQAKQAND